MIDSGLVGSTALGGVTREQKMLIGHLPRVIYHQVYLDTKIVLVDRLRVGWFNGWEGYHESRRCSRDNYPESYITKHTSIPRKADVTGGLIWVRLGTNRLYNTWLYNPVKTTVAMLCTRLISK